MIAEAKIDEYKNNLAELAGITTDEFNLMLRSEFNTINTEPEELVRRYNFIVVAALRKLGGW